MTDNESPEEELPTDQLPPEETDEGPGWMPAIMAGTVLMGMLCFIACGFSTWLLFQNRTALAIRTCEAYVSNLEQSLLEPNSKAAVIDLVETLSKDMQRGKYENWQSAGIMQRLQRLPVLQWGELQAVQAAVEKMGGDQQEERLKQITRLQRSVELGKVTSFDFEEVLKPVREQDPGNEMGHRLVDPISAEKTKEMLVRAKRTADRASVADKSFPAIQIEAIVRREIEKGASEGSY
ncbi:MAG: hypothetical protein AB8B91_11350 [Rubripirellula sp.]